MDKREQTDQDINKVAEHILRKSSEPKTSGDERRQSLVQATYHLIAERGFERLRTRDIAARVGMNIATLHYYFPRKEDLIQAVVEYLLQQFMTAYMPDFPLEMKTPLEQLRGELVEMQYLLQEKPGMFIVMNELILRSLHDPAILRMIKQLDEGWHGYLERIIREGIEQKLFRTDLDPSNTATWLMLQIKGTTLHYLTSPEVIDFAHIRTDIERWLTG